MNVMMKGFNWKCLKRISKSLERYPNPKVMMEVMLIISNSLFLQAFLALFLKMLLERSYRMSLVAIRILVDPVIHTERTQKRRLIGFQQLYTPTPLIKHLYRKRAQRQTYLRFQTMTSIFGLTNPNLRVTQRLMGRETLSPEAQKCVICSSIFSFSSITGGSQFILIVFFIHSFLNFSISGVEVMHDNLNPILLQLMLPASSSRASPYPNPKRQSTSGITMAMMLSFSFFQRLLTCRGLPMITCLFSICPTSCMQRLTVGILVSEDRT